ncbi:AAA family ATPase [Rhizobium laguerreae]|uniref:AAA family ATPase n=1 Tax=Rhizobium laguerreae TaxID=1076926 RepID=UPI0014427DEE|nr:AAA family ATPase [Rhizobium laguerreae]NKM29600.1 AAA family ATPase [Rhizobium laguerreae]
MTTANLSKPLGDVGVDLQTRELHLHTLDSLINDLVSGRSVRMADGSNFVLDDASRSILQWYKTLGLNKWGKPVADGESIVDAALLKPPVLTSLPARPANSNSRRLTLRRLEAHRFAGLHKFGTPANPPENYVHEFTAPISLFEGRNGSGKTSLVNAIIWALTGELLRPQRAPEKTEEDFSCWVDAIDEGEPSTHRLTPVTPMPDTADFRPTGEWIPADTWVELTFSDELGNLLPPVRRTQTRTSRGKPSESADLSSLGLDPVATRIGTIMPSLLGLIKVGSESELGRAVSELTGLSALIDLADHARRAKNKIDKDFTKAKSEAIEGIDKSYNLAKSDLEGEFETNSDIRPELPIPTPSNDKKIEADLDAISDHFERLKSTALTSARSILGSNFDPANLKNSGDLEQNIGPALGELTQLSRLESLARLNGLKLLSEEQLDAVDKNIIEIQQEAHELEKLAKDSDAASRMRLYARIATWLSDHPDPGRSLDTCVACGGSLVDVIDPITGKLVKLHISEAETNATLMSQTIKQWAQAALNALNATLPEALQKELRKQLPEHPCDLLQRALVQELFDLPSFSGVLAPLKDETQKALETVTANKSPIAKSKTFSLPSECADLETALSRLDVAVRFARWRRANEAMARSIVEEVIGRRPKEGDIAESRTLTGKLLSLEAMVKAAKPLTDSINLVKRLKGYIKQRREAETRLASYVLASAALGKILSLGDLADLQVDELRKKLSTEAAEWRKKIYVGAFPSIAYELVGTALGRDGELDLRLRSGGVSAPAQHITNASALRASLVGFYLAFWEHVLQERGGLKLMLFDDPQELLDDENRERLAQALTTLTRNGAQLVLTSYDSRFSNYIARTQGIGGVQHLEVLPATRLRPTVRTVPSRSELAARKATYDQDPDAEIAAREYVDACRVFLESKLGDVLEDPAFSTWVRDNPHPTLASYIARLRPQVRSAQPQSMFSAQAFKRFVDHPALIDNSPTLQLMNKSHHGMRNEIRAGDAAMSANNLDQLTKLAEEMWDECRRWRRRDNVPTVYSTPPGNFVPMEVPTLNIVVCPDLAAFTGYAPSGVSQEETLPFDTQLLEDKVTFYLRRNHFGFAAPEGALAIVEATATTVSDRRLVVARHGQSVYARRLVRSQDSPLIGLTAETPDPRTRTPKTILLPEIEVAVHQVVGIIFDHNIVVERGSEEAVPVDASKILKSVEVAFRVVDESAVPLALPSQIVLGGAQIPRDQLGSHEGSLVALYLSDGSSIFKRVGSRLPGELSHLRQFESIGGLGSSQVLSVDKEQPGIATIFCIRRIIGVFYRG